MEDGGWLSDSQWLLMHLGGAVVAEVEDPGAAVEQGGGDEGGPVAVGWVLLGAEDGDGSACGDFEEQAEVGGEAGGGGDAGGVRQTIGPLQGGVGGPAPELAAEKSIADTRVGAHLVEKGAGEVGRVGAVRSRADVDQSADSGLTEKGRNPLERLASMTDGVDRDGQAGGPLRPVRLDFPPFCWKEDHGAEVRR